MAFSEMELAAAILDIVPHMDARVATIRIITQKLAEHFGVDYDTMHKQKAMIKQLVVNSYDTDPQSESSAEKENDNRQTRVQKPVRKPHVISDEDESEAASEDDGDASSSEHDGDGGKSSSEASDSDSDRPKKPMKRSRNAVPARRKAPASKAKPSAAKKPRTTTDAPGLAALKDMARAACLLSPRVYATLKKLESTHEQEEHVRELLRASGVTFSGKYPQKREIESVRRKKQLEKDLEGIDTSLIIEDTTDRPRRAARSTGVSYTEQLYNRPGSDDDAEGNDAEDDDSNALKREQGDSAVAPIKQRAGAGRKKRVEESEDDDEDEDEDDASEASGSESSEAEF